MVTSQNLFREYILLRSRMVAYAAVVLTVITVIGFVVLISSSSVNIFRLGLVLQILGVLALIPEVVKVDLLRPAPVVSRNQPASAAEDLPVIGVIDPLPENDEGWFVYYLSHNLPIVLGNILCSLALIWLLVAFVLNPGTVLLGDELLLRAVLSLLGFTWLNIFMLIHAYRLSNTPVPAGMLAWFFSVDMMMAFLGVAFAGIAHILMNWLSNGLGFIYKNDIRRTLLIVTLPFFSVGLAFELLASFLGIF